MQILALIEFYYRLRPCRHVHYISILFLRTAKLDQILRKTGFLCMYMSLWDKTPPLNPILGNDPIFRRLLVVCYSCQGSLEGVLDQAVLHGGIRLFRCAHPTIRGD